MSKSRSKAEFGDFQTPSNLAANVCELLRSRGLNPASIIEPTCGVGRFLEAAAKAFPEASGQGMEINESYVFLAEQRMEQFQDRFKVKKVDFFNNDWTKTFVNLPEPVLVIGNPPWVTNAELGTLNSENRPERTNFLGFSGMDALTGKSNFDISEWILIKIVEALNGKQGHVAMLVKTAVARKVLLYSWRHKLAVSGSSILPVNALTHFGAAVDACLLIVDFKSRVCTQFADVFDALSWKAKHQQIGLRDGEIVADLLGYDASQHLAGSSQLQWRSGVKHDCSSVMELTKENGFLRNGRNEIVEIEDTYLYPFLKTSDVAKGHARKDRFILLTQRKVGEDTTQIKHIAPQTWAYLIKHSSSLDARQSSIYKGKSRFSIFGVGDYSFASWKVAISGLYKHLTFSLVGPHNGKTSMVDDATYFIPCKSEEEGRYFTSLLNSKEAKDFFQSRIFWDAKRPITASLLKRLDLLKLAQDCESEPQAAQYLGIKQSDLFEA